MGTGISRHQKYQLLQVHGLEFVFLKLETTRYKWKDNYRVYMQLYIATTLACIHSSACMGAKIRWYLTIAIYAEVY